MASLSGCDTFDGDLAEQAGDIKHLCGREVDA
jgi:hypothetical protein